MSTPLQGSLTDRAKIVILCLDAHGPPLRNRQVSDPSATTGGSLRVWRLLRFPRHLAYAEHEALLSSPPMEPNLIERGVHDVEQAVDKVLPRDGRPGDTREVDEIVKAGLTV